MNLKEIKKLPFAEFAEESRVRWKVTVREPVVDGERLLVIDFLKNTACTGYHREEVPFRIVCAKKSQEVKGIDQNGKVTNSVFQNVQRVKYDYIWISEKEEKRLLRFLGISADACKNHGIYDLSKWTQQIKEEQKKRVRKERGELMEEDYRLCPEALPMEMMAYIRRKILPQDNTIVYKKGNRRGLCYCCGEKVTANLERFTQNATVRCPNCGRIVRCVLEGSSAYKVDHVDNVVIAQKGADGETVFFRQFRIDRDPTAKWEQIEPFLKETVRYGIRGKKTAKWQKEAKENYYMHCERYELEKWEKWNGNRIYDSGYFFCPIGAKEALAGTKMQYADLEGYLADERHRKNTIYFLEYHAKYPVIEFLWKAGYRNIVHNRIFGADRENRNAIYWQREKLKDCFKFPLRYLKLLPPERWTLEKIQRMNLIWQNHTGEIKEVDIRSILEVEWHPSLVEQAMPFASFTKIRNYIRKQTEKRQATLQPTNQWERKPDEQAAAREYRDYLQECGQLNLPLTEKEILFPRDLHAAHQRTSAQVTFEKNKADQEKFQKVVDAMEKFSWEQGELFIRPAREQVELSEEGKALHHCVGGYIKRMAEGESLIFFIRRRDEPNKPYFTLELNKKTLVQCRTEHNQPYTAVPEVKDFVEKWMKTVVEKGGRKKEAAA